jgi:hypothetical protein
MGVNMTIVHKVSGLAALAVVMWASAASAAMYKWVDENGKTHYGDTLPPKYANRSPERLAKSGAPNAKADRAPVTDAKATEQDIEKQKAVARRDLDQKRQDQALLATYANEKEIDLARDRELRRHQDTISMATAGLAKSKTPEDRAKLDNLLDMARKETDLINTRFDGQKARYRELTGGAAVAQASAPKQ